MALTDAGKAFVMMSDMRSAAIWVGLSANGTSEQTNAGYARAQLPPSGDNGRSVSATNGVLTLQGTALPFTVYVPTDGSAPDSGYGALFDSATGGARLTDWEPLSPDVPAPADGQSFNLSSLTFTP